MNCFNKKIILIYIWVDYYYYFQYDILIVNE